MKLKYLIIILAPSMVFSEDLVNYTNYDSGTLQTTNKQIEPNFKIIFDSTVTFKNKLNSKNPEFISLGLFEYTLNKNPRLEKASNPASKTFKLVEITGKKYMISDGAFIVKFKNNIDKKQFAIDFGLIAKYEFPESTAFYSKGFKGLEQLIDNIKLDPRVESFQVDIINPHIVSQ